MIVCSNVTAVAISIISPLELIRTKLQSRKGYNYKGTVYHLIEVMQFIIEHLMTVDTFKQEKVSAGFLAKAQSYKSVGQVHQL